MIASNVILDKRKRITRKMTTVAGCQSMAVIQDIAKCAHLLLCRGSS